MKRYTMGAAALSIILVGCGGGGSSNGGGSTEPNTFAGSYVGTYTAATSGDFTGTDSAFVPPSSGVATAAVSSSGTIVLNLGSDYHIFGTVASDGTVTNSSYRYPGSTSATFSQAASNGFTIIKSGSLVTITGKAFYGTGVTAAVSYTVQLAST